MSVKVNIYGTDYPVKGDADPGYIEEVASYVDGKMREVARNLTVKATTMVAVMAALNITDELFEARQALARREAELERELERLAEKARQGVLAG
jgi:cell division protein ZapA